MAERLAGLRAVRHLVVVAEHPAVRSAPTPSNMREPYRTRVKSKPNSCISWKPHSWVDSVVCVALSGSEFLPDLRYAANSASCCASTLA